jgi:hypothetical protein
LLIEINFTPNNVSSETGGSTMLQKPPTNDLGRFFAKIRFNGRGKLDILPDFQSTI